MKNNDQILIERDMFCPYCGGNSAEDLTADYPYIAGGSNVLGLQATVTPYDRNGNTGEPVNVD